VLTAQFLDHRVDSGAEVGAAVPIGEQVDITAGPVSHAVCADGVAASKREAIVAGSSQRDPSDLSVTAVHED